MGYQAEVQAGRGGLEADLAQGATCLVGDLQDVVARDLLQSLLTLEVVKRTDDMGGFVVLPRGWVAERTFAWLMNSRCLARDDERLPKSSEVMIRWPLVTQMSRRLARPRAADRH
ncbi:hypothetical protein [Streptomyces sp. NPDC096311]|uniref:hypothetical protein n=1 Tax=Streptomyces sp. NPDC096311 TaxID=3366083 RepID=UPI0037F2EF32